MKSNIISEKEYKAKVAEFGQKVFISIPVDMRWEEEDKRKQS